jgi:peroxiredoxin
MKKFIITISLVLLLASAVFTVQNYKEKTAANKDSSLGDKKTVSTTKINPETIRIRAADFTLNDINNNEVTLSTLRGKNVMLNFFATWCPPCRAEMPDMEKLYNETKDSNLVILAVNLKEDRETVKAFLTDNKFNFTTLLDSEGKTAEKYGIFAIPTTFFIDKDGFIVPIKDIATGAVVNKKEGGMSLEEMKSYINALK